MARYIVEYEYKTPFTDEQHNDVGNRADPCLAQYGVTWVATWLAHDRLRMICEFETESAEQIRNALRSAGVQFARLWPAHRYSRG
jgi:hypothetical protein